MRASVAPFRTGPEPVATAGTVKRVIPALLLGFVCIGLLFHEEIAAAIHVWTRSTVYNHCFLVLPIAAYLAWDRRALIAEAPIQPAPWLALAGLPLALGWLAAERIGLMEGRQLVAMCFVELLVFGRARLAGLPGLGGSPALSLLPCSVRRAFAVPLLQSITAQFTVAGLNLLGIPNYSDGYIIEISSGAFYVAEFCAGLRFPHRRSGIWRPLCLADVS